MGLTSLWDSISVYIGPSPREGRKKKEKIDERHKRSKRPPPVATASAIGPCSTNIQISRVPQPWNLTQHLRTTRPSPSLFVNRLINLNYNYYIWYGDRYWSKILCRTIATPKWWPLGQGYALKMFLIFPFKISQSPCKRTDWSASVILSMIIDIGPKFYSGPSPDNNDDSMIIDMGPKIYSGPSPNNNDDSMIIDIGSKFYSGPSTNDYKESFYKQID